MPLYLIVFNDEWVPDLTAEQVRERGTSGRIAVAVGWPQEVHRFPSRAQLQTDTPSEGSS
jgi:hypothetical protein